MGRQSATQVLQDRLIQQFGSSPVARCVVAEEVTARLAGRSKLQWQDLDDIEEAVVTKLRSHRLNPISKFASSLQALLVRSASAPSKPVSSCRSNSDFMLNPRKLEPLNRSSTPSASSGLSKTLPSKFKPVDHFDLFVEFDAEQLKQEELNKKQLVRTKAAAYRQRLDGQMEEVRAARERAVEAKRREQEQMLADVKNQKAEAASKLAEETAKKELRKKTSIALMNTIRRRAEMGKAARQIEHAAFDRFLQREQSGKELEILAQKNEKASRTVAAREYYKATCEDLNRCKESHKESERSFAAAWSALANAPLANELPGGPTFKIAEAQARVKRLTTTLGKEVCDERKRREEAEDARTQRIFEEHEQQRIDDYWKQKERHKAQVQHMMTIRAGQLEESGHAALHEKELNLKQAEIWRDQKEQALAMEKAKQEAARNGRKDMDNVLLQQMEGLQFQKKFQYGLTSLQLQRELSYNKPLLEKLIDSGFKLDQTQSLLAQTLAKGD